MRTNKLPSGPSYPLGTGGTVPRSHDIIGHMECFNFIFFQLEEKNMNIITMNM